MQNSKQSSISASATAGIQGLTPYAPGKPITELEREFGISNAVKLASNENPLGASPKAQAAIQNNLSELAIYPDGNAFELKAKIAQKHGINENCITVGNGSNEILELVARAYLVPGTNCVFSEHAFAVYPLVTQACGASAKIAKAKSIECDQALGHDLEQFLSEIDENTRVVMIANPNNPTGSWIGEEELKSFLKKVASDIVVVVDEAYFDYVELDNYPDSSAWVKEFPNLLVTRTFSKIYGLASLRVGYGLANPELTDILNRVRQPFNVNSLAQLAACAALEDHEFVRRSIALNTLGMQQLVAGFGVMDLHSVGTVGNFICVRVGESGQAVFEKLLSKGVIIRPIDNYQMPGFIRVTIGSEEDNSRFLQALSDVI